MGKKSQVCMTCAAMSGNGVRICIAIMLIANTSTKTRYTEMMTRAVWYAVADMAAARGASDAPIVSGGNLMLGNATLVFDSYAPSSSDSQCISLMPLLRL
jgi:hypothetical protein